MNKKDLKNINQSLKKLASQLADAYGDNSIIGMDDRLELAMLKVIEASEEVEIVISWLDNE